MERTTVLEELFAYRAIDELDRQNRATTISFVEREPLAAERTTVLGHLTSSAWVINHCDTHVLLMHHRKLEKWLQPGGHADGSYALKEVAIREVFEETGVENLSDVGSGIFDIDVHEIPARGEVPHHLHFDIRYAFRARLTCPVTQNSESLGVEWVELSRVEEKTNDLSILRMRRKWIELLLATTRPHPSPK